MKLTMIKISDWFRAMPVLRDVYLEMINYRYEYYMNIPAFSKLNTK